MQRSVRQAQPCEMGLARIFGHYVYAIEIYAIGMVSVCFNRFL